MLSLDATVTYAVSLAKQLTDEIGFLPKSRYHHAAERGRLRPQSLNGEPCGFLIYGPLRPNRPCHVWQTAVQTDARRLACATELIEQLAADAAAADCTCILLRCALDLDAVHFWPAVGFQAVRLLPGGSRRGRQLVLYRRDLEPRSQLLLFKPNAQPFTPSTHCPARGAGNGGVGGRIVITRP